MPYLADIPGRSNYFEEKWKRSRSEGNRVGEAEGVKGEEIAARMY